MLKLMIAAFMALNTALVPGTVDRVEDNNMAVVETVSGDNINMVDAHNLAGADEGERVLVVQTGGAWYVIQ